MTDTTKDWVEILARRIRTSLGPYNDEAKSVERLIDDLVYLADALKAENQRMRDERDDFASNVVEFSEIAASLIEDMSKKPGATWGQVKAAVRALGDLGTDGRIA